MACGLGGLLRQGLRDLGRDYGDFPAHNGLWYMAQRTAQDPLARMAMVPRVLEARGLDVTPPMIGRFRQAGDLASVAVLEVILAEEEGHVEAGSRWFRYLCRERGLDALPVVSLQLEGAVSDDGMPVVSSHLMRRALEYATMLGMPVVNHAEDPTLVPKWSMHEGEFSTRLGLAGLPVPETVEGWTPSPLAIWPIRAGSPVLAS